MSKEKGSRYHVPNLERALEILELLAKEGVGMTIAEMIDKLGYSKNSIYRITMTLTNRNYLRRDEETKKFFLSRKLLPLGFASISEHNIIDISLSIMKELRDTLKESVLLGTLLYDEGIMLEQVAGGYPFKLIVDRGTKFNLHSSAPGKAIMAYLPEQELEGILSRIKLTRFNERTITKKSDLIKELKEVRKQGYALDHAEHFESIHCIAAPIFNESRYPEATIWVTATAERLPERDFGKIGSKVKASAMEISKRLGYNLL